RPLRYAVLGRAPGRTADRTDARVGRHQSEAAGPRRVAQNDGEDRQTAEARRERKILRRSRGVRVADPLRAQLRLLNRGFDHRAYRSHGEGWSLAVGCGTGPRGR